jgi:GntR family transcriptional regulator, transcriptional repressor for pyruvate dehydrogenase complex
MDRSLFVPISSGGRADAVTQRITEAISLGLLQDGEQLPSETELAAQLGVSTVTLREALANLRQQGLVETRRGRHGGSFVRRPQTPALRGLQDRLRGLSTAELRDIGDEHAAVSSMAAGLAADRAGAAEIARLTEQVEALRHARTPADQARADGRFHIEVAVASQSERLTRREVALQSETAELLWLTKPAPMDVDAALEAHARIVRAVADEDVDGARRLAEEHVRANIHRLVGLYLELTED